MFSVSQYIDIICETVTWPGAGTAVPSEPEEGETFSMASNMAPLNHTGLDGLTDCHTGVVPAFKIQREKGELIRFFATKKDR